MREKVTLRGALIGLACLGIGAAAFLCIALSHAAGDADFETLEKEIVKEVNLARTNPAFYASWLRGTRPYYRGTQLRRPGEIPIRTQEGIAAVDEAIRFLEKQKPVGPSSFRGACLLPPGTSWRPRGHRAGSATRAPTGACPRTGSGGTAHGSP